MTVSLLLDCEEWKFTSRSSPLGLDRRSLAKGEVVELVLHQCSIRCCKMWERKLRLRMQPPSWFEETISSLTWCQCYRRSAVTPPIKKQAGALCKAPAQNNSLNFLSLLADGHARYWSRSQWRRRLTSARSECEASKSSENSNNFCNFHIRYLMLFGFILMR